MPEICLMFRLRILCVLAATVYYVVCDQLELQISFPTLKSDLEWILESATTPTVINIEYSEGAVLQLTVVPKVKGRGMCIRFGDTLNIKLADESIVQKSDAVYSDGSLGLPLYQDTLAKIIIKPDINKKVQPAFHTIRYTSMLQLTKDLHEEAKDLQKNKFFEDTLFSWPHFRIGSSTTMMIYSPKDEHLLLKKPLKGISLRGEEQQVDLLEQWHKKLHHSDSVCSSRSSSSDGLLPYGFKNLPNVFFDVWYDPEKRRYGSSSGSLRGVDAVRVYEDDEWKQQIRKDIQAEQTHMPDNRGEHIRRKVLAQDLDIAYRRLNSEHPVCDNVVIDYAGEIRLDVRAGAKGDHRYVTATGIRADVQGGKPKIVKAFFDLENLEYSDEDATAEEFVPETGEKACFFKYIDWGMFKSHMESVWAAMQGGCTQDGKRVYQFNMFYGEVINVRYYCENRTLAVIDTLFVLTDIPKTSTREDIVKAAVSKCKNVLYLPFGLIESPCLFSDITPIAIQLQPEEFWLKKSTPVSVKAGMFENEINILAEKLKSSGDSRTIGTVLLDDGLLFGIKLAKQSTIKIHGNFAEKTASGNVHHNQLVLNGVKFSSTEGVRVALNDVRTLGEYVPSDYDFSEFIIASDYLTIKKLKLYLRAVMHHALNRCSGSSRNKSLWFKLVRYRKFALEGFYDCSKRVILVEGQFKSMLFNEVRPTGLIKDFIYLEKGQNLILGSDTLHDVYAISVPELTNYKAAHKQFGGPVAIDKNSFIMFKFKENSC